MISKRNTTRLVALFAGLSLASAAEAAMVTAFNVDSSLGGFMNFIPPGPVVFNSSQSVFTIPLTAINNGTTPYQGVALAIEFIYPANPSNNSGIPVGNGFQYLLSEDGTWADDPLTPSHELQFSGASSTDYPSISYGLQLLSPLQINVPLTDSINAPGGPYTAGPLLVTDSIPLIQLGDFAPGEQKQFTLIANSLAGGNFHFASDAYFVADSSSVTPTPEPSSIALAIIGGLAVLFARQRMHDRR